MRTKSTLIIVLAIFAFGFTNAQSADEIVKNYFENTGGYDAWGKLEGLKMTAKVNQGGMEIPLEIVVLKDGKQYTKISLQGNEFMQGVFDGEVMWSTNFQTQTAEKVDAETTANQKLEANDFPSGLYNYKDKGYKLELMGEETIEGTETFKLKLTKEPITVDGNEQDDVTFYYFDKENFVLLAEEEEIPAGPAKGMMGQVTFSDYDEVNGLYFPFSMSQGVKGGQSQAIKFDTIEANPTVDATVFAFPDGE
ncbi:LolA family protein [Fulvivirga lutimaris]|uniref:LolA family protein n=1 Tax=Fulvivirga lutimaris TaxID=1819566 RepID=UPI0012BCE770|nr:outer membrane lipoprotein-sorting protein [Fulvivirga lutimaris]MTI39453.1 outer membrane lipoprotein-sorting protein [Fulvivirga lutimaris]